MRKSIVLLTLAALTSVLAVGCAPAAQATDVPHFPHVTSDFVLRKPFDVALSRPAPAPAPVAVAVLPPHRARTLLARPAGRGDF